MIDSGDLWHCLCMQIVSVRLSQSVEVAGTEATSVTVRRGGVAQAGVLVESATPSYLGPLGPVPVKEGQRSDGLALLYRARDPSGVKPIERVTWVPWSNVTGVRCE